MSTNATTYTIGTSLNGILIPGGDGGTPERTPKGMLVTRAVETQDGWLGQLIIDKEIVFQGQPQEDSADAMADVNGRVIDRLKQLFIGLDQVDRSS